MSRLPLFLASLIILAIPALSAGEPQKGPRSERSQTLRWISISSDSRDIVHEIIRSEVENRDSFSTLEEDRANQRAVEREKETEDVEYKSSIVAAGKEFARAKRKRDDLTSQFQIAAAEYDDSAKGIKTIRATIENLEGQIARYEQDKASQSQSLKRWLKSEKQGEALVAVIYTRGFKASAHELEASADRASAPLLARQMGTYVHSFTEVINNITSVDFIRTTEKGSCKWNNEEPLRMELSKSEKGTTYLRLKRYELYPFQESSAAELKTAAAPADVEVAIINSRQDLDTFLTEHGFSTNVGEPKRIELLIRETAQGNSAAEDGLRDQVKSFQDRISLLVKKIAGAKEEAEAQKALLRRREDTYHKMSLDVAAVRERKDAAERAFQEAQSALNEKKRNHESIIVKTAVANAKGSQTPAEASAEAILDKLAEVKNDAKTQHSSSTTEVTNFRLTSEQSAQSISEARIIAVRLISFLNEGESVRVKMAFRVKTVLDSESPAAAKGRERKGWKVREPAPEPAPEAGSAEIPAPATEALQCRFTLREARFARDGLHLLLEVTNRTVAQRKVAFYDDSFGSWPRTRIDAGGQSHEASKAYLVRDGRRILMMDLDSNGHGVQILPDASVTMELVFQSVPAGARDIKIDLHPFIYYMSGKSETWQEFNLPLVYKVSDDGIGDSALLPVAAYDVAPPALPVPRPAQGAPLASKEAMGCSFQLRKVSTEGDGIHLVVEVVNGTADARMVAFYDDSFGSWSKSSIYDQWGKRHDTTGSYLLRDGRKVPLIDLDKKGRVEVPQGGSVTMELVIGNLPAGTKGARINLHPFIYYKRGWFEKWAEFDLPMNEGSATAPALAASSRASVAEAPRNPATATPAKARMRTCLASKEARGCCFDLQRVELARDGLHLHLEVLNNDAEARKVAFYDDSFGSWPRTTVSDDKGRSHETSKAYAVRDGRKTPMIELEKNGRGIEIAPGGSVEMELAFQTVPSDAKKAKIKLHPFIYYQVKGSETWEEFDLPMEVTLAAQKHTKGGAKKRR